MCHFVLYIYLFLCIVLCHVGVFTLSCMLVCFFLGIVRCNIREHFILVPYGLTKNKPRVPFLAPQL